MDSHGGWISSSLDLLRFGLCVDGSSAYTKVLTSGSIAVSAGRWLLGRPAGPLPAPRMHAVTGTPARLLLAAPRAGASSRSSAMSDD